MDGAQIVVFFFDDKIASDSMCIHAGWYTTVVLLRCWKFWWCIRPYGEYSSNRLFSAMCYVLSFNHWYTSAACINFCFIFFNIDICIISIILVFYVCYCDPVCFTLLICFALGTHHSLSSFSSLLGPSMLSIRITCVRFLLVPVFNLSAGQ